MKNKLKYIFIILVGIIILFFPLVGASQSVRNLLLCMIPNTDFWYGYMSYVGAILAIITALFIVKWEDIIKNKKNVKIQWLHTLRGSQYETNWIANKKTKDDKKFNYLLIKIINNGNKLVTIASIHLVFYNKISVVLGSNFFTDKTYENTDIKVPYKLDVDECVYLHIPIFWFGGMIETSIDGEQCTASEKINIVVTDTADRVYKIKLDIDYNFYLQYYNKIKPSLNQFTPSGVIE